jgi:hypothetical protein
MTVLRDPDVLYRTSLAKYAAAFFKISRSNLTLESSFFKLLISSDAESFAGRNFSFEPEYALTQQYNLLAEMPSSRAVWLIGWSDSKANLADDSLNSAGYCLYFLDDIVHYSFCLDFYIFSVRNSVATSVWLGRGETVLEQRRKIKQKTLTLRKQLYQQKIAA